MARKITSLQEHKILTANRRLEAAREAWAAHRKGCYGCSVAHIDSTRYCSEGWDIAVELTRARRAVYDLEPPAAPDQLALF